MPTSSMRKSAPNCIAKTAHERTLLHAPRNEREHHIRTRQETRVSFLHDAKMRAQDAATVIARLGLPLFSQLFVFVASFSPKIRDEWEGGSGYKKPPPPKFTE